MSWLRYSLPLIIKIDILSLVLITADHFKTLALIFFNQMNDI